MRRGCSRAASLLCFCAVFVPAPSIFAVNLDFSAAAPNEHLGVSAHAGITFPGDALEVTEGISGLPNVGASAGAQHGIDVVTVSSSAEGGLYTNIALDSPVAFVSMLTTGLDLPPELSDFDGPQYATGLAAESGSTYAASFSAVSALDTFDKFNPQPVDWVIDLLPSAGEIPGTPVRIHIDAIAEGTLTSTGNSNANSAWSVEVNDTQVLVGSAALGGLTQPFGGTASHDFVLPLGSSFDLRFLWTLAVSGNNSGTSRAEFTAARIDISATVIPEPSSLLVAIGLLGPAARIRFQRPAARHARC
jgi:hypothetical protein